ncbi:MAG: glycerol-3-phosphate 1-O-acyltransferase PlsY [Candidatus Eisenbacteria bacterium]
MERIVVAVVAGYLLGSIPFSYVTGRLARGIDLRRHGSGNLGAANTFRTLGAFPGVAVLLLDASKGAAGVLVAGLLWRADVGVSQRDLMLLGGVSSICGHIWTVFAGFKGGKGVASAAGVFAALAPPAFAACVAVWVSVVAMFRYISLGSVAAAVCLPPAVYATLSPGNADWRKAFAVSLVVAALVVLRHRGNLKRIRDGTEARFSIRGGAK